MTILTFAFLLLPFALLGFALVGNGILSSLDRFGVAEIVAFCRPHILIQLENEWNARGNIVFDNIFIRNRVEIFYQRSERIAVSCNQNSFAGFDLWHYLSLKIWYYAFYSLL